MKILLHPEKPKSKKSTTNLFVISGTSLIDVELLPPLLVNGILGSIPSVELLNDDGRVRLLLHDLTHVPLFFQLLQELLTGILRILLLFQVSIL